MGTCIRSRHGDGCPLEPPSRFLGFTLQSQAPRSEAAHPWCVPWPFSRACSVSGALSLIRLSAPDQEVRSALYMNWVNELCIPSAKLPGRYIEVADITQDFQDGTVIVALVKHFAPNVPMRGTTARAVSKHARARNVEESLNVLRQKTGKIGKLHDIDGILRGLPSPTMAMLEAAVIAFVVRPQLRGGPDTARLVTWTREALIAYGRDMMPAMDQLEKEFGNGVSLCCLVHAYGEHGKKPDMSKVYWEPQTEEEERSNVSRGLRMLERNVVPCVFNVDTWCHRYPARPVVSHDAPAEHVGCLGAHGLAKYQRGPVDRVQGREENRQARERSVKTRGWLAHFGPRCSASAPSHGTVCISPWIERAAWAATQQGLSLLFEEKGNEGDRKSSTFTVLLT